MATSVAVIQSPAGQCVTPPAGLVSWWPGEGNAHDVVGNNSGTLENEIAFGAGEVGQGIIFDGYRTYVDIPDSPSLRFAGGMTVEAWVAISGGQPYAMPIVSKWDSSSGVNQCAFTLGLAANSPYAFFAISTNGVGATNPTALTGGPVPANVWFHIAGTFDGDQVKIYINGVLSGSAPCSGTIFPGTNHLGIGASIGGGGLTYYPFNGVIDEISVYDRALSAIEIQAIHSAGGAGKCGGTNIPPIVVSQPVSQTVFSGQPASFTVLADGSAPLTYSWSLNGTNLAGSTNATFTLASAATNDAGGYAVVVANAAGSVTSSPVTLTVIVPPPCDPAPSGLVGWWPGQGNSLDAVGGNPGTLMSGATFGLGEVGEAFKLGDGAFVRVPDAPNLRFTNAMTLEAWINPASIGTDQAIVSKWDAVGGENQAAYTSSVGANGNPYFGVATAGGIVSATSSHPVPANQWSILREPTTEVSCGSILTGPWRVRPHARGIFSTEPIIWELVP